MSGSLLGAVSCHNPFSSAREDDELLGRAGHRDIAVDGSFDAYTERVRIDQDDEVELEAFRGLRGQRPYPGRRLERAILEATRADDADDTFGVCGKPRVEDRAQVGCRP